MDICIDFDGTCVTHEFPNIGKDVGAVPVLQKIVESGHNLILFTMRSNKDGNNLNDAVEWFEDNDISLYGVNKNPKQRSWTSSQKAYGQLYIDESALGCPVINDPKISDKPFADWQKIESMLTEMGVIKENNIE